MRFGILVKEKYYKVAIYHTFILKKFKMLMQRHEFIG